MSLLKKIRNRLHESREKGKEEKKERKVIDSEARKAAYQEYLASYRKERINVAKTRARTQAKHDASGSHSTLGSAVGIGKAGFNMFSKAGRNLMESGAFDLPGTAKPQAKKGKKKKKPKSMFEQLF
jgi:hypothetical protein